MAQKSSLSALSQPIKHSGQLKHREKTPNKKLYERVSNTSYICLKYHEQTVISGLHIEKTLGYLSLYHAKLI